MQLKKTEKEKLKKGEKASNLKWLISEKYFFYPYNQLKKKKIA